MNLITKQQLANIAKERWKEQYCRHGGWNVYGDDKEIIYNNLVNLADTPSPDDVDKAIGNSYWTSITCSECGEIVDSAVVLGTINYDSEYVYACKNCLTKALELF